MHCALGWYLLWLSLSHSGEDMGRMRGSLRFLSIIHLPSRRYWTGAPAHSVTRVPRATRPNPVASPDPTPAWLPTLHCRAPCRANGCEEGQRTNATQHLILYDWNSEPEMGISQWGRTEDRLSSPPEYIIRGKLGWGCAAPAVRSAGVQ